MEDAQMMLRTVVPSLGLALWALTNVCLGQATEAAFPPPVETNAQQDHQRMMGLLQIKSLRPGVDGNNPKAPNAANTDESKANPYPNLPDPLVLKSGEKVTTAQVWSKQRRAEIVEDFDREIYGRVPADTPKVKWEVVETTRDKNGDIPVVTKKLVGHVDNSSYRPITVDIELTLTTPANATGPVPVMMEFGFSFGRGFGMPRNGGPGAATRPGAMGGPGATTRPAMAMGGAGPATRPAMPMGGPGGMGSGPTWQQQVLAQGWGYAILMPNSVQADSGDGMNRGIIGLCNKGQPRKPDDWGALRAWAWGASRALDYLETDPSVNAKQVGIEGMSRYGKATVVTMAYDPRFAIAFVGSSGEGGAKLHRRNFGELVENVASSGEYHWMAGNFLKYAGPLTWNDLPVDAHELIALCAPRPVLIGCGSPKVEGTWVDDTGMFMATVAAGPVYRLLGKTDLGTTEMPPIGTPLIDGDLAFSQHAGGHTNGPNWPTFLKFASRYMKAPAPQAAQPAAAAK
jgi:(4-O-methyl)-D-glucuronate---lignin esterase